MIDYSLPRPFIEWTGHVWTTPTLYQYAMIYMTSDTVLLSTHTLLWSTKPQGVVNKGILMPDYSTLSLIRLVLALYKEKGSVDKARPFQSVKNLRVGAGSEPEILFTLLHTVKISTRLRSG